MGEVLEIVLPGEIIGEDGLIDIEKADTVAISGIDCYHKTVRIPRLSYAKQGVEPEEI